MTTTEDWPHLSIPGIVRARSRVLANNHYQMLADLVTARKNRGMTQADVAEVLGISPQAVSKFERYDADPKLSTLQRYANAVGVIIETEVQIDTRESLDQYQKGDERTLQSVVLSIHFEDTDEPLRMKNTEEPVPFHMTGFNQRIQRAWSSPEVFAMQAFHQHVRVS